jgi:C-terminal peptidase prc
VDRLIARLGDERFARREQATAALRALDEQALESLRKAASSYHDAEVRRRARRLVSEYEARWREAEEFAATMLDVLGVLRGTWAPASSQGELVGWAVRSLYDVRGAAVPAELARRLAGAKDMKESELGALLRDAHVRASLQPQTRALPLGTTLQQMLRRLDPHADCVPRSDFTCILYRQTFGIGLLLERDPSTQRVRVLTPLRNSPAHRAGLRAGDVLLHIIQGEDEAGQPLPQPDVTDTRGLSVSEVVEKIVGPHHTHVGLSVRRAEDGELRTFVVQRAAFVRETVAGWRLGGDDEWDYWLDRTHKIAYIRIVQFDTHTLQALNAVLDRLARQGMKGLILDLRFNPGGLLLSVCGTAERFIGPGPIMTFRSPGKRVPIKGGRAAGRPDCPLACLINEDTESGAEVLAACLQDHKRAILVGERSRGRGSVQNIHPMTGHEWDLKFTTAVFCRPNGEKVDRIRLPRHGGDEWGVRPDPGHAVALSPRERERLKAHLDSRAVLHRRDRSVNDPLADFNDRQRDHALAHLRSLLP